MPRFPLVLMIPFVCLAAACDPFDRPGTYRPTGVNDANLAVTVARPADLSAGQGDPNSLGAEAAAPVDRLLAGKRRALPIVPAGPMQAVGDQTDTGGSNGGAQQ